MVALVALVGGLGYLATFVGGLVAFNSADVTLAVEFFGRVLFASGISLDFVVGSGGTELELSGSFEVRIVEYYGRGGWQCLFGVRGAYLVLVLKYFSGSDLVHVDGATA